MTTTAQHNYTLLLNRLDQFIRKYYINQLIRGSLYFLAASLSLYLVISGLEYLFFFPGTIRTILLIGYLTLASGSLVYWVGRPLLAYFKLGATLSHDQAALIIGKHFPNIEDKLLNILQLQALKANTEDATLIEASINQKITQLAPIPFVQAINLRYNRRYVKYALIPIAAIVLLLLGAPSVLEESNERLLYSNRTFERPAPFQFEVVNGNDLSAMQYANLPVTVRVTGDALPNEVLLQTGDYQYRLTKEDANTFSHTFRKVDRSFSFVLQANGYRSAPYEVTVIPKPMIVKFTAKLDYPDYIGKKDETRENIGDLVVPAGTRISWLFEGKNTDRIDVRIADSLYTTQRSGSNTFQLGHTFLAPSAYTLFTSNVQVDLADSIGYFIGVTPDAFPQITVEAFVDSMNPEYRFIAGEAEDDYGLTQIAFRYQLIRAEDDQQTARDFTSIPIRTNLRSNKTSFTFPLDLQEFRLKPGDVFSYYFVVWDNDAINGSKSAKTPLERIAMPTEEAFREMAQSSSNQLKKELAETLAEVKTMQQDIRQLQDDLLQQKDANWSDKQKLEQLMDKQQRLNDRLQDLQREMSNNRKQQQQYQKEAEEIQEKQQQLEKMMDELLTDEMKEMMAKLDELMQKLNKEEMLQELGDFEMNNEQLEKELDRMMELFKQLEFEARMQDMQQQLEELAQQQEALADKTEQQDPSKEDTDGEENNEGEGDENQQNEETGDNNDDNNDSSSSQEKAEAPTQEQLKKEQAALNEAFEKLKEELEKLDKMDKDLGDKMDFSDLQEQQEQTQQDMEESLDKLEQNQNQQAGQQQRKAQQQMQQMAQQMNSMMQSSQMQQMAIDMEATRQILDNLIKLSFDQENLMASIEEVNVNTPAFKRLIQEQFSIQEDIKMVEDSLLALSKRVVQISSFVNKEITSVKYNMGEAIDLLADRKKPDGTAKQQYVMTGLNNLALMLDEILHNMQDQMSSMMAGQQMCQKPKDGQSMQQLQQMQQQLNQQMSKMMEKMNEQQGQGQPNKPGQQGKGNEGRRQMSKELAEMAAKQAAIRQALQALDQQLNKDGQQTMGNLGQLAKEMEKTEEDIVNRQLTLELLKRQQEISVRLLEAAEAEKQREQSPQREADQGTEITRQRPPALEEYLQKRAAEIELYKTVPPALSKFYKNIVEEYFKSININD